MVLILAGKVVNQKYQNFAINFICIRSNYLLGRPARRQAEFKPIFVVFDKKLSQVSFGRTPLKMFKFTCHLCRVLSSHPSSSILAGFICLGRILFVNSACMGVHTASDVL